LALLYLVVHPFLLLLPYNRVAYVVSLSEECLHLKKHPSCATCSAPPTKPAPPTMICSSENNRFNVIRQLLKLLVKVLNSSLSSVLIKPVLSLLDSFNKKLLVIFFDLAAKPVDVLGLPFQAVGVFLELDSGLIVSTIDLVLLSVILSLFNHALGVLYSKTIAIRNDKAIALPRVLVKSRDFKDIIVVELKSDLDLRNATSPQTV
jgi:hypothetical protein